MTKSTQKIDNLEVKGLIDSLKKKTLDSDQMQVIEEILSVFMDICSSLEEKKMSIQKLKKLLGIKTEKDSHTRGIVEKKDTKGKKKLKNLKAQTVNQIQQMIYQK